MSKKSCVKVFFLALTFSIALVLALFFAAYSNHKNSGEKETCLEWKSDTSFLHVGFQCLEWTEK